MTRYDANGMLEGWDDELADWTDDDRNIDAANAAERHEYRQTRAELTEAEHQALVLTVGLFNLMCRDVVGYGPSRRQDLTELAAEIHQVQHRIMSQAAARAYPHRYRLLGESAR